MNIIEKAISLRDAAKPADGSRATTSGPRRKEPRNAPHPVSTGNEPARFGRLMELGMLPDAERDQLLIEQLRHLKRPILQNSFGPLSEETANLVMITSARPGAGKSFVSASLAYALTRERELSVVIVDLDNIRATLTRSLGLSDRVGFFDAVEDPNITLESTLLPTEIPGLWVIPTGRQTQDSAEFLNSARTRQLLGALSDDDPTRIIILDTPPLLVTPDAHAILELAHQIVVIVEAGVTKQSDMRQVLGSIRGDKPIGLVLNKATGGLMSTYGGNYYASGYNVT